MTPTEQDKELREAILTEFKQVYKLAGSGDYTENCTNVVMSIVRTEKLKLLDEVIHQSTVNLKSARAVAGWAELRKKQLAAELKDAINMKPEQYEGGVIINDWYKNRISKLEANQ